MVDLALGLGLDLSVGNGGMLRVGKLVDVGSRKAAGRDALLEQDVELSV